MNELHQQDTLCGDPNATGDEVTRTTTAPFSQLDPWGHAEQEASHLSVATFSCVLGGKKETSSEPPFELPWCLLRVRGARKAHFTHIPKVVRESDS